MTVIAKVAKPLRMILSAATLFLPLAFLSCNEDEEPSLWVKLDTDSSIQSFNRFLFFNESDGFVTGLRDATSDKNTFFLLRTNDGGNTWTEQNLRPPTLSGFAQYFHFGNGFIIANGTPFNDTLIDEQRELFKSFDYGLTWQKLVTNYGQMPGNYYFFNEQDAILLYGNPFKTTDGFKTIQPLDNPSGINFFGVANLMFTSSTIGYASGGAFFDAVNYGKIVKTTDAGETWQDLTQNVTQSLAKVSSKFFVDDNTGFIFTVNFELYLTTDGGATWEKADAKTPVRATDCYFFNKDEGVIMGTLISGDGAGIYRTKDGGKNWKAEYKELSNTALIKITFPTPTVGYAITNRGTILKYNKTQ